MPVNQDFPNEHYLFDTKKLLQQIRSEPLPERPTQLQQFDEEEENEGTQDSDSDDFELDYEDYEEKQYRKSKEMLAARSMADCRVIFPKRAKNARKAQSFSNLTFSDGSNASDDSDSVSGLDSSDKTSSGARIAVINKNNIIAGYCDGSIRLHRIPDNGFDAGDRRVWRPNKGYVPSEYPLCIATVSVRAN
jgi:hypothetical protein